MWNDTDIPLAYLITFRCYGTWLHGDERGSIDRFHNRYQSPYINPNERWHRHNAQVIKGEPVTLDESQRKSVELAIRETCTIRRWRLHAVNVRTNHIHAVVSIGPIRPERTLTAFKANSTRQMRADGCCHMNAALGPRRVARDTCGMSAASRRQSNTCFMDMAMSCRTLTTTEVSTGSGSDRVSTHQSEP